MPSLESINELLSEAAKTLDLAASEIRDAPLEPAKENISRVGEALTKIYEVQLHIYESRPDLKPDYLKEPIKSPGDNRALGIALVEAGELAEAGRIHAAIAVLEKFIKNDPAPHLRGIAEAQIERYRKHGT